MIVAADAVILLTGVTLPFVSYGGSSIVANMVFLAAPDRVRPRPRGAGPPRGVGLNKQIGQLFILVALMFAVLVAFTSYWTVLDAEGLEDNSANRRPLIEAQKVPRGLILASDGTVLARSRGSGRATTGSTPASIPPTPSLPRAGLLVHRARPLRDRAELRRRPGRPRGRVRDGAGRARGPRLRGLRRGHQPRRRRPAHRHPGARGRAGSVGHRAADGPGPRDAVSILDYDPNQVPDQARAQPRGGLAAQPAPCRPATSRARPSRW